MDWRSCEELKNLRFLQLLTLDLSQSLPTQAANTVSLPSQLFLIPFSEGRRPHICSDGAVQLKMGEVGCDERESREAGKWGVWLSLGCSSGVRICREGRKYRAEGVFLPCAEGTACKSPPDVGKTSQAYYFVDRTTFVLRLHEGPGYVLLTHTGLWTCSSPQGKPGEVCHLPGNPAGWRGRHEGFG